MLTLDRAGAAGLTLLRVTFGAIMLIAGWAKLTGVQAFDAAGFLKFATAGTAEGAAEGAIVNPTHDFWVGLAGNAAAMPVINNLVVFGEIAIGIALIAGLMTRFAGVMGALMMLLFWVSAWDFAHGFINEHLSYAVAFLALSLMGAGRVYGLDALIEKRAHLVERAPALRFLMA